MSAPKGRQGEILQAPSGAQKVPLRVSKIAGVQVKRTILKKIDVRPKITLFETFGVQASSKGTLFGKKKNLRFEEKPKKAFQGLRGDVKMSKNWGKNASAQKASKI